jgi:hypothetical protein
MREFVLDGAPNEDPNEIEAKARAEQDARWRAAVEELTEKYVMSKPYNEHNQGAVDALIELLSRMEKD